MATYTAPTTRTTGALISASIWNTDIVENLKYFKDAPVFDGDISVGDDIFLTSTGAVINFASGDVTITHSTDALAFAGAANGYTFANGPVRPATNDGAALGTTATQWSDLFLASGSVINFDNGDVTLTHSTNTLTFAGATNGYTFDRQIKAASSQVEVGGFFDMYAGAGYDIIGFTDGTALVVGGYRASQWATVRLYASGAEALRINSGQELLVGYTTDQGAYLLQVNSQIFATNATIATSDGRFKTDVQPVREGLAAVKALQPVQFRWKKHPVHNFIDGTDVGFIAQDVRAALTGRDYTGAVVTQNGSGENEFLGMADSKLIPLLVAAVQELSAEVNALKAH